MVKMQMPLRVKKGRPVGICVCWWKHNVIILYITSMCLSILQLSIVNADMLYLVSLSVSVTFVFGLVF